MGQAAEVAEDDYRTERLGESGHFGVEGGQHLGFRGVDRVRRGLIGDDPATLSATAAVAVGPDFRGDLSADAVQPATERVVDPVRPASADQDQERGLEGVVGVGRVVEDSSANAPDHRAVAENQGFERRLTSTVGTCQEAVEEFAVG